MTHRGIVDLEAFVTATVVAVLLSAGALAADVDSMETAVQLAERHIRSNGYDTERDCPDSQERLDAMGAYDSQPHCRHYHRSEDKAFAVSDEETLWRVYFRKIPPAFDDGRESFRVIEVFRSGGHRPGRVMLKDIELFLPEGARILGGSQPRGLLSKSQLRSRCDRCSASPIRIRRGWPPAAPRWPACETRVYTAPREPGYDPVHVPFGGGSHAIRQRSGTCHPATGRAARYGLADSDPDGLERRVHTPSAE